MRSGLRTPELARAGLAGAVLVAAGRRARRGDVSAGEERVFRLANDAPAALEAAVWAVSQSGSLGAVFVTAGALVRSRGRRSAGVVAVGGTVTWLAVKAVKAVAGRGRPADLLADVAVRGAPQRGRGFPSGHAAVSTALALSATRPGAPRALGLLLATVTACSRAYLGAHLPLDLVGGAALGTITGTLTDAIARSS